MRFNFFAISAAVCLIAVVQAAPTGDITNQVVPQTQEIQKQALGEVANTQSVNPSATVDTGAGKKANVKVYKRGGDTARINNLEVGNASDALTRPTGGTAANGQAAPATANVNTDQQLGDVNKSVGGATGLVGDVESHAVKRDAGTGGLVQTATGTVGATPAGSTLDQTTGTVTGLTGSTLLGGPTKSD
ncbi:hypothetical protein DFQ28_001209 [Apophysomyces sp. BC1034]|nr:hypothetical protein DFQ30_001521 [Apophysomyces sp. BC1015]KAG0180403.1 hypothetical protein DFQ29_000745 [Apophysomyces sp. BC1021]KAG0190956.1 hypothetical protein DFQ28_001209 [Apophysomyces sp. BC1034]